MNATRPASSPRCFECFRPAELCFCAAIPAVSNRTGVLILQHRRERFHPFNTARIVRRSLQRCQLLADHNTNLADRFESYPLSDGAGLLYPGDDARLLTQLAPSEQPDQLVILDGTWHHAKTLMRDIPRLRTLPRYRLAPSSPGRYRIRREPNQFALSTLEATVAALTAIEPETSGLDRLLSVFDRMIDDQLTRSTYNWRQNGRRRQGAPNIPRALTGDLSKIVVAYGEREPGNQDACLGTDSRSQMPVYWTAKRLVSGETFQCAIQSPSLHDHRFMAHLQLSRQDLEPAVSMDAFCERWNGFLRPGDRLAVHHRSTAMLLDTIATRSVPTIVLKSINTGEQGGTLDVRLTTAGIETQRMQGSRASQRLANAIAYVRHLNSRYT